MAYWIIGFILGNLAGRAFGGVTTELTWLLFTLGVGFCVRRSLPEVILIVGVYWGAGHAALLDPPRGARLRIVNHGWLRLPKQFVIARAKGGLLFEIQAYGQGGRIGRAHLGSKRLLGAQAKAYFKGPRKTNFQIWLKQSLKRSALSPDLCAWVMAVVGGTTETFALSDLFRRLGLFHLCVISGFHLTLLASIVQFLFEAPMRWAYGLRKISPLTWMRLQVLATLLTVIAILWFSWACGLTQPIQRALWVFLVANGGRFFAPASRASLMLAAAVGQSLIFPVGFLSDSNLFSWVAYMVVGTYGPTSMHGLLKVQWSLFWLSWAVIGLGNPAAILCNLVFTPVFPFVFIVTLAVGCGEFAIPGQIVKSFFMVLQKTDLFLMQFGMLSFQKALSTIPGRMLALSFSSVILLNTCRELSIRKKEPSKDFL